MSADPSEPIGPRLEQVQRWMQSILMHRGGVAEGVDSPEARTHIDITLDQLPSVIRPSRALSSANRLEIYVNAYYARLLECLDEEFVETRWTLGDELFAAVAFGYLQSCPSQSYTLNQLGARFPQFLAETRLHAADMPPGVEPTWPQFVVELATLERSLYEVYDGPGTEQNGWLDASRLAEVPPDAWGNLRLSAAPCLRLHAFSHDVSTYWGARKDGTEPAVGPAKPGWLAISRLDYIVERHPLSQAQYWLLDQLVRGQTLEEALAAAAQYVDASELEQQLGGWFAAWLGSGFFSDFAWQND